QMSPAAPRNDNNFENVTMVPNTLLSQSAQYDLPDLPCAPGGFVGGGARCQLDGRSPFTTGAVVLSGVVVPGQGLVPLGISAALDAAGNTDSFKGKAQQAGSNAPPEGTFLIDFAPPHDGIEGNLYVTVAIALDFDTLADGGTDAFGASIITSVTNK